MAEMFETPSADFQGSLEFLHLTTRDSILQALFLPFIGKPLNLSNGTKKFYSKSGASVLPIDTTTIAVSRSAVRLLNRVTD